MMLVDPGDVGYAGVQESDPQEIFASPVRGGTPVQRAVDTFGVKEPNKKPGSH